MSKGSRPARPTSRTTSANQPALADLAQLQDAVNNTRQRYQLALDKRGAAVVQLFGKYDARDIADTLAISRQKVYDIISRHNQAN